MGEPCGGADPSKGSHSRRRYMKRSNTFLALAVGAGFLLAACSTGTPSQAPAETTDVRLQLQWAPQAQFAGYFAADRRGLLRGRGPQRQVRAGRPGRHPAGRRLRPGRPRVHDRLGPEGARGAAWHAASPTSSTSRRSSSAQARSRFVEGLEHHQSGRLRRQEGRRLGLRQRVRSHGGRPQGRARGRHRLRRRSSSIQHGPAADRGTSMSPRR